MAKRRAAPKKKKSTKKGSQNKPWLVIIILLIICGVVFYGLNETGKFTGESVLYKPSSSSKTITPKPKTEPNQQAKKTPNPKTAKQKKIDATDISSTNGLLEKKTTNKNLPEYSNSEKYYYTSSFDFSWPAYTANDVIVEHQHYTLSYNEKYEQANWVAYTLTADHLNNAKFKRKDNFKSDPDIITGSATIDDYKKSGFDRGHLAPAADFTWTEEGMDESFYMSNMSPQVPGFNRGIWKVLEEHVRDWAKKNNTLYIVTGPYIDKKTNKIGKNKVCVPQYYYKAILDINEPELKAIGFLLKNEKSSEDIMTFAMSIDQLEEFTGLDFFPLIPDDLEDKLESQLNKGLWK